MVKCCDKNKEALVIDIIHESFRDNPSVISAVKQDNKIDARIGELARYAFRTAVRRNGVFLSSNNAGVAICYAYNAKKNSVSDYINQLRLLVKAIGVSRVSEILKREFYIKKIRPQSGEFLYFWFYGVRKSQRGSSAARELKEAIFELSKQNQLPIYLETSVEKNRIVYERFGFEVYHSWERNDHTLWFMKREPID